MTTRGQILRSSVTGNAPAAGTRAPGELWTTFPDLQLGVIDATKTAQKLIAVRYFSTQANYATNDYVVQAGKIYFAKGAITAGAFNASQWTALADSASFMPIAGGAFTGPISAPAGSTIAGYLPLAGGTLTGKLTLSGPPTNPLDAATKAYADGVSSGLYLPLAGGTLTGPLVLAANPAAPLQSATKAYVDALPLAMNDNRIINGDMRIDQRNNGASGTVVASAYWLDRWQYGATQLSKFTFGRNLGSPSVFAPGFPYCLGMQSASNYTPLAGDTFAVQQMIEADTISDFAWGTANAQPVTLSFWALSGQTGNFSGSIRNTAVTRSYPFSYSIPAANVWTKIVITIPGDTAGTWVMSGNAGSLSVAFELGGGSTYRGAAGAWVAGNVVGVTGAVSVVSTLNATLYLTGVKLEIGSVATPFNRQSLAKSMADCQRYYVQPAIIFQVQGYMNAGGLAQLPWSGR